MHLALFGIGLQEGIIIALAVMLFFGATRIPQLMRGVGQGIKEFKDAVKDEANTAAVKGDAAAPDSDEE